MTKEMIAEIVKSQRKYFDTGITRSLEKRREALKKLRKVLRDNESKIAAALKEDLGKSGFESYMCETGMVLSEIDYICKHMGSFSRKRKVRTPLAQFPAKSYVQPTAYGVTLIMSPWNYPLLLTLDPLVDALAAGNTAVVKPSAYAPATAEIIRKLLEDTFPKEYVAVVTGGREENGFLLEQKFDYIFFTGSKDVGKLVLEKAAAHLTPVTLELGGKSPCIVHDSADLELAARRIVFGKYLNCGQTCVAPDYILCEKGVKDKFVAHVIEELKIQYKKNYIHSQEYGKIINEKHFDRILALIDEEKVLVGGGSDRESLKIEPTVLDNVTWNDKVMQEEIFGPLMPILTYESLDEVIRTVNGHDKPLALYLFAEDKEIIERVMGECAFGGGCVNDTIIHLATSHMGFGGVGESGMGSYHGKSGFDTFSHYKSIVDKKTWLDLPMRYHPYRKVNEKLIRMFLR